MVLFLKSPVRGYTRRSGYVRGYERAGNAQPKPPLPPPREKRFPLLSPDLSEEKCLAHVMRAFGANWKDTAELPDLAGYRRYVSAQMFTTSGSGASKITKSGRHVYLNYIVDAVKSPQEMWLDDREPRDKTLYCLAQYKIQRKTLSIVSVFKERGMDIWLGWSAFQNEDAAYYEDKRKGKRVFSAP